MSHVIGALDNHTHNIVDIKKKNDRLRKADAYVGTPSI